MIVMNENKMGQERERIHKYRLLGKMAFILKSMPK